MIDLIKAKETFKKYVNNYDINDPKIELKITHTFRVMDDSLKIATSIPRQDEENIKLAELIGLLHDIGRFEQVRIYHMFEDRKSVDHGNLGVEILKKDNFISEFCEDSKYYDTIFKAIHNHNKFRIEENISGEQLIQCKIIRDADKVDILNSMQNRNFKILYTRDDIGNEDLTEIIYQNIIDGELPLRSNIKTDLDDYITMMSFIYDIYYKESFKILKENNYMNVLLDRVDTEKNHEKISNIRKAVNDYIDKKINE